MHTSFAVFVAAAATTGVGVMDGSQQTPAGYSNAVMRICAGAVLFDHTHRIGTRAGAIAVSHDIRATGERRLRRVDAVPKPSPTAAAVRWITLERRLVDEYARDYLLIWNAIERANTPAQRAALPSALTRLVHASDALAAEARALEARLQVPDCTGGIPSSDPSRPGA